VEEEEEETDKKEKVEGGRRRTGCQLLAMFGILSITLLCHNDPNSSINQQIEHHHGNFPVGGRY